MSNAVLDEFEVMNRCYDVVNSMFIDQGIHPDMIKQWWWTNHQRFDYRSPIDALLDGDGTEVYKEAELYCEILRPLQKAKH